MSLKYRLVERNNPGKDKDETPKKLYAQPNNINNFSPIITNSK